MEIFPRSEVESAVTRRAQYGCMGGSGECTKTCPMKKHSHVISDCLILSELTNQNCIIYSFFYLRSFTYYVNDLR